MADDHKMFASGIANLLEKVEDFSVIGIFQSGADVLASLKKTQPDILLTDLNMPGMDGLDLIHEIVKKCPKCKIIVLSMYDEEKIFKKCEKAGAKAYVLKDADSDELIYTIREVYENRHVMNFHNTLKQATDDVYLDGYKEKVQALPKGTADPQNDQGWGGQQRNRRSPQPQHLHRRNPSQEHSP